MKAIVTKYHGATDTRGSRISATAQGGPKPHRISIPYPHELNQDEAHAAAAAALCKKLNWAGRLISGGLPDGRNCHVFAAPVSLPDRPGKLSFDGCGINLPDEYRTRLANFHRELWDTEAKVYGPLFAAAPETLAALKQAAFALETIANLAHGQLQPAAIKEIGLYLDAATRAIDAAEGTK